LWAAREQSPAVAKIAPEPADPVAANGPGRKATTAANANAHYLRERRREKRAST
jgi:hypothetical protein